MERPGRARSTPGDLATTTSGYAAERVATLDRTFRLAGRYARPDLPR